MANILKSTYVSNGNHQNSIQYDITVTVDGDISGTDVNSYLPNHDLNYGTISGITIIPTGSLATIFSPTCCYYCNFIAEFGSTSNINSNYKVGQWVVIGKKSYITI